MKATDLPAVSSLGIRSKASWAYGEREMRVFAEELTLSSKSLTDCVVARVAEVSGVLAGYFTLRPHGRDSLELEHLFVDPARFGEGIGRRMLNAALEETRSRGMRELILISDPNAEGFYRKQGARRIGEHQSRIAGRKIPIMSIAIRDR